MDDFGVPLFLETSVYHMGINMVKADTHSHILYAIYCTNMKRPYYYH